MERLGSRVAPFDGGVVAGIIQGVLNTLRNAPGSFLMLLITRK